MLSPILFMIFMADFLEVLEGLSIKLQFYMDDILIYCDSVSMDSCRVNLQEALKGVVCLT